MAEAIIARSGMSKNIQDADDSPLIIPGFATAIVTVVDSSGKYVPRCAIQVYDGQRYLNANTNSKGKAQVLLNTQNNRGMFQAFNYSYLDDVQYLDHKPSDRTWYDCNTSASTDITIALPKLDSQSFTTYSEAGPNVTSSSVLYKHGMFLTANKITNVRCGGAGGGGYTDPFHNISCGGGGGSLRISNSINIPTRQIINNYYLASGGKGTTGYSSSGYNDYNRGYGWTSGGTGGTTSFMGIIAEGGNGGSSSGGIGADNGYWGNGKNSSSSNANSKGSYGGGGGCWYSWTHGSPNGGNGGNSTPRAGNYLNNSGTYWFTPGSSGKIGGGGGGGPLNVTGSFGGTNWGFVANYVSYPGGSGLIAFDIS